MPKETNIKKILNLFEKNTVQVAIVVDEGKLIGTVTDGDIRRAILANLNLDNTASSIMNNNPIYVFEDEPRYQVELKIKKHDLRYIPVVDKNFNIKRVYSIHDFIGIDALDTPVVIMAGGEGSRLRPITEKIPKPMVELAGRPLIEKGILDLIGWGFNSFYISINYLGQIIKDHFQDGKDWGISISYLEENKKLGTAGCLSLLKDIKKDFFVINGDLVTDINYLSMLKQHQSEGSKVTMAVKKMSFMVPYGVVINDLKKVRSIQEKPVIEYNVNCGIYVMSPLALKSLEGLNDYLDMPSFLEKLIKDDFPVSAFSVFENWHDIANIRDLEKIENSLK